MQKEQERLIKVSPVDIPLLANSISEGFVDKGWIYAGIENPNEGIRMGFRDATKKHYAVVALEHDGILAKCAYKAGDISNNSDQFNSGVTALGGLAAFTIGALTFPMLTLGATALAIGNALFSTAVEEKVAEIIKSSLEKTQHLINQRLRNDLEDKYDFFICHRWEKGGQYSEWLSNYYAGAEKKIFFFHESKDRFYGYIPEVVCEAIRRSEAMILVLSPGFFDSCGSISDPCRLELETAIENSVPILPIRQFGYTGSSIPDDVPEHIRKLDGLNGVDLPSLRPWESVIDKISELHNNAKRLLNAALLPR